MTNTSSTTSFDWVRHISKSLIQLDEIPILGTSKPFPWTDFSNKISSLFELNDFDVKPGEWQWRTEEELLKGLGHPLRITTLALSPLAGKLWWIMAEEDLSKLMTWLLTKTTDSIPLKQEEYREAFYRFAVMKALHLYQQTASTTALAPSIIDAKDNPNGESFCLDVTISCKEQSIAGRLLISKELRKTLKEFLAKESSPLMTPIAQDIEITVSVEGGKTAMSLDEWHHVHAGDFVLLDSCTVDASIEEKRVVLAINGKPFLQGTLKNDKLKITEAPLTHEVDTTMADDAPDKEHDEAHHEGEEDDEFADIHEDFDDHLDEHEEELQTHEHAVDQKAQPAKAPAGDHPETVSAAPATPGATVPTSPAEAEKSILSKEIPISLTVEVARVRMNVQSLMNLQAGNMIDLAVHPEQGVNLTINGKIVGRGELLRIGDTLGVRVLEIN